MIVCPVQRHSCRPAFSLVELVIVVVIIGIIGAIVAPRLGNAAANSNAAAVAGDLAILNKAAELYAVEHGGLTIGREPDGSVTTDASVVAARLTGATTAAGALAGTTQFGPYLRAMPVNPYTKRNTIRLADLGIIVAQGAGWVFEEAANSFAADQNNKTPVRGGGPVVSVDEQAGGAAAVEPEVIP